MAEKEHSKFTVPSFAVSEGKQCKKRKTVQEKAMHKKFLDKQRNQTRVNIGVAFQRWREVRDLKGLKSDSLMAVFLLDRLMMRADGDLICDSQSCCKSVGTDLSMLDIDDFITEISQLKKEVALLQAKLRDRGDKLHEEDVGKVSCPYSVCPTDGTSTESQGSALTCKDQPSPQQHTEQRSRDPQELSLTLICYTEPNPTDTQERVCESEQGLQDGSALSLHSSSESLGSVYNGGEQQFLQMPLKMCSVRLVDSMIAMNIKQEITARAKGKDFRKDDDDEVIKEEIAAEGRQDNDDRSKNDDDDDDDDDGGDDGGDDDDDGYDDGDDDDDEDDDFVPSDANSGSSSDEETVSRAKKQLASKSLSDVNSGSSSVGETVSTAKERLASQNLSCSTCGKTFSSQGFLARHEKNHTIEKCYSSRCGMTFFTAQERSRHSKMHRQKDFHCEAKASSDVLKGMEKSFACSECERIFSTKSNRDIHMRIHTGEKPFKCPHCEKSFYHSSHLKKHVRSHTKERPYECSKCGKTFIWLESVKLHQQTHSEDRPYQCSYCDKNFRQKFLLIRHERVHTGERPYLCAICGKSFTNSGRFKAHQRVHTGEKPYHCKICGKSFSRQDYLTKHKFTHGGERNFKCSHCDKGFTQLIILKIHERTHTGEKPYQCFMCGKRFGNAGGLYKHKKIHTKDQTPLGADPSIL